MINKIIIIAIVPKKQEPASIETRGSPSSSHENSKTSIYQPDTGKAVLDMIG